jgi:enamine deaminase RidA (YjgF/YER057c/UK114 family)
MSASVRLGELGVVLPQVAAPLAAYVPAVRTGNLVYTSGQLPLEAGKLAAPAKSATRSAPRRARRWRGSARSTPWPR